MSYQYGVFANIRQVVFDNGIEIEYIIDGRNRRIGKKVNGTLLQGFLWDDQLRIAAELDGAGNVVSRFVYGTHVNVPELMIQGTTTYRIVTDQLGSPRLVINTVDGSIAQRLDFDEFGVVTLDTDPGFQPFGFAGGFYDPQTTLVRFGARDYDPQVGRFATRDPFDLRSGELNVYAYALNNPLSRSDVLGLSAECECEGREWSYVGGGGGFALIWGKFWFSGAFKCRSNPSLSIDVAGACTIRGPMVYASIEVDFSVGWFLPAAKGCSAADLLGRSEFLSGSFGSFGASGDPRRGTGMLELDFGLGGGFAAFEREVRPQWWTPQARNYWR